MLTVDLTRHTTIVEAMPQSIPHETRGQLALDWRHTYFKYNEKRRQKGLPPEDIDTSHRNTLPLAINNGNFDAAQLNEALTTAAIDRLIQAWHEQKAWPDTKPAIESLKQKGYEVFVHANGTTRLQLGITSFPSGRIRYPVQLGWFAFFSAFSS